LWLRRHFRNDGSHGICGGESGTKLNLITLLLALVFLIFSFALHHVRPVNPRDVTTCTRIMSLERCRLMEGYQYFEGNYCVHLFYFRKYSTQKR
jgi:hypothetical protein